MRRSLARSASFAVAYILTGALLVGCGGTGSVPGPPARVTQPSLGQLADLGTHAQSAGPIGGETMTGVRGSGVCGGFGVTGTASGPYPGKFKASGTWSYGFSPLYGPTFLKSFSETFTITHYAKTITGSFIWNGGGVVAYCQQRGYSTITSSSNFTYTATLTRGRKVIKQFAGSASESGISFGPLGLGQFGETLN
jgi:hypothetical protein